MIRLHHGCWWSVDAANVYDDEEEEDDDDDDDEDGDDRDDDDDADEDDGFDEDDVGNAYWQPLEGTQPLSGKKAIGHVPPRSPCKVVKTGRAKNVSELKS